MMKKNHCYPAPEVQVILLETESVLANSYKDGGDGLTVDFAGNQGGDMFRIPGL